MRILRILIETANRMGPEYLHQNKRLHPQNNGVLSKFTAPGMSKTSLPGAGPTASYFGTYPKSLETFYRARKAHMNIMNRFPYSTVGGTP